MHPGLFERVRGTFLDGTPIDEVVPGGRGVRAVMDHLSQLFNTRRGLLPHLPAYGLPDISEVYRGLPGSADLLADEIKDVIERYEPRLHDITVSRADKENAGFTLTFIVSARMRGGKRVRFQTRFFSAGNSHITPFRPAE